MNDDDLDRMLMEREEIVPSSGFVASVMEAVQQEAVAPAPIPFPWKWALPGLIVSVAMAMGMIARWFFSAARVSHPAHPSRPHRRSKHCQPHYRRYTWRSLPWLRWSGVRWHCW